MPSFARERAKVLTNFVGIPEALAQAFDVDPKTLQAKFHRIEHHQAHVASTFFVSPFESAALLSADGLGDFASTMWASGRGNRFNIAWIGRVSALAGHVLYGADAVSGLLEIRRRVQSDGPCRVRPARISGRISQDRVYGRTAAGFELGLDYFSHHRTGPEMTWRDAGKTPELGRMFSEHLEKRMGPTRNGG